MLKAQAFVEHRPCGERRLPSLLSCCRSPVFPLQCLNLLGTPEAGGDLREFDVVDLLFPCNSVSLRKYEETKGSKEQ